MCVLSNECVCVFLLWPQLQTSSGDSDKHYNQFLVQGGASSGTVNNVEQRKTGKSPQCVLGFVCVSVCVCVWERERELTASLHTCDRCAIFPLSWNDGNDYLENATNSVADRIQRVWFIKPARHHQAVTELQDWHELLLLPLLLLLLLINTNKLDAATDI